MGRHTAARRPRTFTKVRAVLAGALVLGVGATMTLASWTDTEFASGAFATSKFDTQSSIDGSAWADSVSAPGATITFAGTGMSPDTHRYGYVLIRTKPNSVAGTLAFVAPTVTNGGADVSPFLGSALQYKAIAITAAGCSATTFSTGTPSYIVGTSGAYAALATAGSTGVALPAATASAGAPVGYCFDVYLPVAADPLLQGKSTTVTWNVTATSVP
jgi:predicted ribosomally synthesized peptide with SipW-like signal peptide